ncbi:hypothetical protein SAMN05421778_13212 [Sphaerotilus natans]|uniref:hypothetical protein n=1 Tax=Sphaerotilus natans TaxID=34103 RepID=UPI00055DAC9F|nr:hypothetical protein [Sphaerotilus natans]SIS05167.1 hypothetical protein SAMN05421778_13212 [Sphaerotilus natans]
MHQLLRKLQALIAPGVDDVRVYRWPEHAEAHEFGCPRVPDGIVIRTCDLAPPLTHPRARVVAIPVA